ncbi:Pyridoxal kinase [Hondaea fermentalgiana]|uniref:pyridoxal kinase n=1 Tax=Hondaea fermentalgiana TaxID=2315210 RepID=A0A2R5GUN2_9STRA|nr:Pyridoxal kinase [Hondaea fermentalgiana]|eukprot:GBG32081.1 Pyridoxal kinase [Hondaea fermentalgiana]
MSTSPPAAPPGLKQAIFPLQLLGFDVDPINSVQFSNHTGYKEGWEGEVMNGAQLAALLEGLGRNKLLGNYSYMLTGYIGSVSFLRQVLDVFNTLRNESPEVRYFCDPVLGDKGKLYVPKELVEVYKAEVLPVVSVLTPNQFELELLTEMKVTDVASARVAFEKLHERGVGTVVLTSCDFTEKPGSLLLLASVSRGEGEKPRVLQALQPRVSGHYTGTGDLIAALLLAWMEKLDGDIEGCILRACTTMNAVVERTKRGMDEGVNPNAELLLIQSRRDIESPDTSSSRVSVQTLED